MSYKPQEVLFASPLGRHSDALTAVREATIRLKYTRRCAANTQSLISVARN